jgi:nucleotide-binding universal stress UspA family protein
MFQRFRGKDRVIVAGVKFDGNTLQNLQGALDLAKHTHMTLRLVHVIEKWQEHLPGCYTPGSYFATKVSAINEDSCIKDAKAKLAELRTMIPADITVEENIIFGSVAESLICDAVSCKAALIMCSFEPSPEKHQARGLSTIVSLLANAGVPILALPRHRRLDYQKAHFKIVACDSLLDDCAQAMSTACEFGMDIGNSQIIHLHIHRRSKEELAEWGEQIRNMLDSYQIDVPDEFAGENIIEKTHKKITHQLNQRIGMLKSLIPLKPDCSYSQQVLFGDLFEEFLGLVRTEDPDLIAFGRHQRFHLKAFTKGSMPSYAMLGLDRPILTVA